MPKNYLDSFQRRHLGISNEELEQMLETIGVDSMEQLINQTVPDGIRMERELNIPSSMTEYEYLNHIQKIADKNKVFRSYIGQGYYGTVTPSVILRNIFHNPGWYTQYTPYQAEIAQGRLEALLNFQTMVSDLTALPIANASLLDEATAAAEAMAMFNDIRNKKRRKNPATRFFVDNKVWDQTLDVMYTRAEPIGIEIVVGDYLTVELDDSYIGVLVQFPSSDGNIEDYRSFTKRCNEAEILVCVATDLLSLTLLTPPGEWGADAVVGNSQRFGIPMGYGGPHAAFFATKEEFKRLIPGRIIGVSQDAQGNLALRMALQTREQHIKRERATSNICTAQALLAVMAGMYAVYHGPEGLTHISTKIQNYAGRIAQQLNSFGYNLLNKSFFDTLTVEVAGGVLEKVKALALDKEINFWYNGRQVTIAIDETVNDRDLNDILEIFAQAAGKEIEEINQEAATTIPENLRRTSTFMTHEVFSAYHTETKMMRYIKRLENKDLSLMHSMISLGSCTMKLNAATELIPVTWPEFGAIHPFVPLNQVEGYLQIFEELEDYLSDITGFAACSLQPNSGAQGEYSGLMTIAAYHKNRGEAHRNVALIPSSAHGTNPASAVMAGKKWW